MNHHGRFNPVRVLAALTGLCLLLGVAADPALFRLNAPDVTAVGGYDAVDSLGQIDTAGEPVYGIFKQNNGANAFGFENVYAVAMDSVRHNLFVSDGNNSRVLVYELDVTNNLIDRVADNVIGQATMKESNAGTQQDILNQPVGLAVDEATGRLFVADTASHRVLVFDVTTITDGEDAINVLGQTDFTSGGSTLPSQSNLTLPNGLAYDADNDRLFVVEAGGVNRVTVFDVDPSILIPNDSGSDGPNAINVLGQANFTAFGAATTQSRLNNPTHAIVDETGQRLFVLDMFAARVLVFDVDPSVLIPDDSGSDGPNAINVIGQTDFFTATEGLSQSEFDFGSDFNPGIAYDAAADRLFVADGGNERVMVFDVDTGVLIPNDSGSDGPDAINVLGQTDFDSNTTTPSQSQFGGRIGGMFYDGDNDLLFATDQYYHRILIFDALAITNGEAAVNQLGHLDPTNDPVYVVDDTPDNGPSDRGFAYPESIALDTTNHRMFVTDADNNRVLVFDLDISNQLIDRFADHVLGQDDFKGHGSGVLADTLLRPSALAYRESTNQLFVADQDHNRVLVFDVASITDGEDAAFVLGQEVFTTGVAVTDIDGMATPRAIGLDDDGDRLFVVEAGNNRVTVFDISTIDNGEDAVNVLGQADFISNGSGNGTNELSGPLGAEYDGDGQRLFVVDGSNNRVLVFDVDPGVLVPNDPGSDGPAATNQLGSGNRATSQSEFSVDLLDVSFTQPCVEPETNAQPVFDAANNRLFVSDSCNSRIMIFDTSTIDDQEDAVDVVGQDDFDTPDGGGAQDKLNIPQGLAFNPANNYLYVADTANHRVMVFEVPPPVPGGPTAGHEATDVLGQLDDSDGPLFTTGGADNGPNRRGSAQPVDMAVDHVRHRLFLADLENNRVVVHDLDVSDQLIDTIADSVIGQADFKHNDPTAGADGLFFPAGLSLDEDGGLLYVADSGNNRVLVFDVTSVSTGMDAVNVLGQPDFDTTDAATTQSGMSQPQGVNWYEEDLELFVADYENNRVLVFDISTIDDGEDAEHVLGQPGFFTNTAATTATGMDHPIDVEYVGALPPLDSGLERLYVAERGNFRVTEFDVSSISDGEAAEHVLGQPNLTTSIPETDQSSLSNITRLSHSEADGTVFVADQANNRIMVWDVNEIEDGEPAVTVIGQSDFDSNASVVSQTGLSAPEAPYFDDVTSLLYVVDGGANRVLIYDGSALSNGMPADDGFSQLNPDDTANFTAGKANNGPNAQGLEEADGVAVDTVHHRLFALDLENDRVLVFNLNTDNTLQDHTADFVLGHPDFKSGSPGTSIETLNEPGGISYDSADDLLFVADTSNNRVIVYDTASITNGEDAIYQIGQPDFNSGDCNQGATADSDTLCHPLGISIEPANGFLAVSDQDNNRVLIYDLGGAGLPLLADGMDASRVFGQPDFIETAGGTSADEMSEPSGILAETTTGSIWVTEEGNNRVLRFDLLAASSDPALNVLGQPNFTSSGEATTQSGMTTPVGVAIVESGGSDQRLLVVDGGNSRVLVFNTADGIDDGEDAVDAYGQPTFSDSDCTTTQTGLCLPSGVDYDETLETLYVADSNNHRIMIFGPGSAPTPTPGGGSNNPPTPVGFTPGRIIVNEDDGTTDSRNVLVQVYATTTGNFTGTVDVLLSNTTSFTTFVPFRYVIPEVLPNGNNTRDIWPKTIAWDLCFGLTDTTNCSLGTHTVYARFYVNVPAPTPALVRPTNQ